VDDKLKTTAGTRAILALEDASPSLLWESAPGSSTPLWLQVRMQFSMAMAEAERSSIALPSQVTRTQMLSRLVRSHLPSKQDATRFPHKSDVLFLVGGMTLFVSEGATHNWLIDDFALAVPKPVAVAQSLPLSGPPPFVANTRSLDLADGRVDLTTRLRPVPEAELREVDRLVVELANALGTDIPMDRVASISRSVRYQESRRRHVEAQFERMLDRVQPRVVIMEDASYGSRAPLISLIKARGIKVIEPQHGWIGPSHAAYNYGKAGNSDQFRAGMPDLLMTFGEYWNRNIRYPAPTVAIGKPQMDAKSADLPDYESRPREIVVISSIAEPDETAKFTLALRNALPSGWRVLFRPHPAERPHFKERYPLLFNAERVRLDENRDVLDSLRQVRGVVGVASTVLYEALAMGAHVFVRDTRFSEFIADPALGDRLSGEVGIDKIVTTLTQSEPQPTLDPAAMWMPNATQNFAALLEEFVKPEPR
jgi:hypothetical protein